MKPARSLGSTAARLTRSAFVAAAATLLLASPLIASAPAAVATTAISPDDVIVFIANRKFAADAVSSEELRRLYLGLDNRLAGQPVSMFHLANDQPQRALVERTIIGKEGVELREHWVNLMLQGRDAEQPRVFRFPEALVTLVEREPGALAYVPLAVVGNAQVKILDLDGRQPISATGTVSSSYPLVLRQGR